MGLAPRAASVRATPAQPTRRVASSTVRSMSNTTRKRDAPTPCPPGGNGGTLKRSRIGPTSTRSASSSARTGGIPRIAAATPTPASGGRKFGQLANGAHANSSRPPVSQSDVFKSRPIQKPGKRRQSFKPRPSLAAGLLRGVAVDEQDDEDLF